MVYVQKGFAIVVLGGSPETAAYQHVQLYVIMAHVMPRPGSVTVPMDIQVCENSEVMPSYPHLLVYRTLEVL